MERHQTINANIYATNDEMEDDTYATNDDDM